MRERERQSARARSRSHRIAIAPNRDRTESCDRIEIAITPDLATELRSRSHRISRPDRDRDLAFVRSHRIEIVVDAISRRSRSREGKIAPDRDRRRRFARSHRRSRSLAQSSDGAIWVVACVFLNLCFPSSFPNTRKYFPENFLKCNQTPWKHFPFPKISISGKYVFSGKRFTATKHSLNIIQPSKTIMLTNLTWNKGKCFIHYQNWSLSAKNESTIIVLILKTNIKTKAST